MKSLFPNNKIPTEYRHSDLVKRMDKAGVEFFNSVGVGYVTAAILLPNNTVEIYHHATHIITLYSDDTVWLNSGGYHSQSTKKRLNMALHPLGLSVVSVKTVWKIYVHATGEYKKFVDPGTYDRQTQGFVNSWDTDLTARNMIDAGPVYMGKAEN